MRDAACPNDHGEDGVIECWSPGGPCPDGQTECESCGPCHYCAVTPDDLVDVEALLASPDLAHLTPGQVRVWAHRHPERVTVYGYRTVAGRRRALYSLKQVRDFVRVRSTESRRIV